MAKIKGSSDRAHTCKKTRQGNGKFTKRPNRGGGNDGSPPSKLYRKLSRGQGK
jgi:hypothetical protein